MDPVSNLIIKIKNASAVGHPMVVVPYTKLNAAILEKLEKKGYIKSFSKQGKGVFKTIEVELVYEDGKPKIEQARRVSKLSRRVYEKSANLRSVRRGYGIAIISTPKGILTDAEARKARVGGEILFQIW
ncbi:MAG: 30S ribosomal protein S8 [Patescibacteria group bacterium]